MRSLAMDIGSARHRITVDEYYHMSEVGLLAPDARTELIEGEIIEMASIGPSHAVVVDMLTRLFVKAVNGKALVRVQGPVRLSRYSEPVPDLAILKPKLREYRLAHPSGSDTLLAIEVSDSSLRFDREVKVPLYARHEVPEVWIVNLRHQKVQFYRGLEADGYTDVSFTTDPGMTGLTSLPEINVELSGLFG